MVNFEKIKSYYQKRLWTKKMVRSAVIKKIITEEQYEEIIAEEQEEENS